MNKLLFSLIFLISQISLFAQEQAIAFKGAFIHTAAGESIQNGVLIIENGVISEVGGASTAIPSNAEVIDVTNKVIIPGLVDTHSHLGGPSGGDRSAALNPDARALDAVNPMSDGWMKALAGGITTINVMPGSGHLMSGQTIYVKMRNGITIEDLLITNEKGVTGGMKMANGTNSIRSNGKFPGTRGKSAAMDRELFVKAVEYKRKIELSEDDPEKMPDKDLGMEAMLEILNGNKIVHFHSHKAYDILTAIRLSKEFNFRLVLHHVTEGFKVADEIAAANVPCSIINLDSFGGKEEAMALRWSNGHQLQNAGVLTSVHTDDGITDSRLFLRSAAFMIREGMSEENALKALTINGAEMLDLSSKVGSLEVGKDADFVILSGNPFSVYTKVLETWVEGEKRFDRENPEDKAYAVGGFDVYDDDRGEFHHHIDQFSNSSH